MYRGYPIAVVAFLSTGLTIGTSQYAFGEFAAPLREAFGWSQTALNLSLSLAVVSGLGWRRSPVAPWTAGARVR